MDIITKGDGLKFFTPNSVKISICFENNAETYESALENGIKSVNSFIDTILSDLNIEKEKLKTTNFTVKRNLKYNYETKNYDDHGYDFTKHSSLSFDFDIKLISKFIERVAKLELSPRYTLNFTLKDISAVKKEVLSEAFKSAEEQAKIIASATNKTLIECLKIDFRPFTDSIISDSNLSNGMLEKRSTRMCSDLEYRSISKSIEENFNPEEIEIIETLYCLWKSE